MFHKMVSMTSAADEDKAKQSFLCMFFMWRFEINFKLEYNHRVTETVAKVNVRRTALFVQFQAFVTSWKLAVVVLISRG